MSPKSPAQFLKLFLTRWLERLENDEKKTPRAQKKPWYQWEYHLPPMVVAIFSSIILYVTLCWGMDLSLLQAFLMAIFVMVLVGFFSYYLVKDHSALAANDDAMALLAVIFITTLFLIKLTALFSKKVDWLSPFLTPVSMAALLAALLLHPRLGVLLSFVMAMVFGLVNNFSLELTLVAAVGGISAVTLGSHARNMHHIWRLGLFVGLMQLLMVCFLAVMQSWPLKFFWVAMPSSFISGILAALFSLSALPFLQSFFSRVSNLRLLELSDVNHPLLKKMSIEAPGTYHHSLIVAALAEDAAEAINANGLLCRAGAYFHDIGKMVKAEYFIENQGTVGNPHDQVSPSLSKLVITSHVKEGMALARQYKLDQQVIDFIPQHHGTSQIEYFYQKALKLEAAEEESEKEEISEETYRYPGPKPQTKEAGIVMMADSVEAAGRTVEEPNHQRFKDLVYKIVNKKLFDGQLDETSLTLKDLHAIAERFTNTLMSVHHSRIPYPEALTSSKKEPHEGLIPPR